MPTVLQAALSGLGKQQRTSQSSLYGIYLPAQGDSEEKPGGGGGDCFLGNKELDVLLCNFEGKEKTQQTE